MARRSGDLEAGGGPRRVSIALLDLTSRSDAQLSHARTRRIVAVSIFLLLFTAGGVLLADSRTNLWMYVGIALTSLGALNTAISGGGLWRVLAELRGRRGAGTRCRSGLATPVGAVGPLIREGTASSSGRALDRSRLPIDRRAPTVAPCAHGCASNPAGRHSSP